MSLRNVSANLLRSGVQHRVVIAANSGADKFASDVVQKFIKSEGTSSGASTYHAQVALYDAIITAIPKFDGKSAYYKRLADAIGAELEKTKRQLPDFDGYATVVTNSVYKSKDIVCAVRVSRNEVARYTIAGKTHGDGLDASAIISTVSSIRDNAIAHHKQQQQVAGNAGNVKDAAQNLYTALDALAKELKMEKGSLLHELNRFYII